VRPSRGEGREEGRSIGLTREEAGARGVLSGEAEDVVQERGGAVELRSFGDVERLELLADALEDLQQRGGRSARSHRRRRRLVEDPADERHSATAKAVGGGAMYALTRERGSSRTARRGNSCVRTSS
jgi:hypothetical protein